MLASGSQSAGPTVCCGICPGKLARGAVVLLLLVAAAGAPLREDTTVALRGGTLTDRAAPLARMPLVNFGGIDSSPGSARMESHAALFEGAAAAAGAWRLLGIDTALVYGEATQKEIGRRVANASFAREKIFLTTKVPCCAGKEFWPERTATAGECHRVAAQAIELTVAQLNLSTIDLLLMHYPCSVAEVPGGGKPGRLLASGRRRAFEQTLATYAAMEDALLSEAGVGPTHTRIRALGLSNFNAEALGALLASRPRVRPSVVQNGMIVGNHAAALTPFGQDEPTVRRAAAEGLFFTAYSPLGAWTRSDVRPPAVLAAAEAHGVSPQLVALRWLVQRGLGVVTASASAGHVVDDLRVFDFRLSAREMEALGAA